MTHPRFIGRAAKTVARDLAAIRDELGDIDAAQQVWHGLDRLARNETASTYTRRRAARAAVALASLLDDITADDEGEHTFTWNDPPADAADESEAGP